MGGGAAAAIQSLNVVAALILLSISALHSATTNVITVAKDGSGNFKTIQAAIDSVAQTSTSSSPRLTIRIKKGIYVEKVRVKAGMGPITMQGDGATATIIRWNDVQSTNGVLTESATLAASADGFVARDLTIQNTAPNPGQGATDKQAVALRAEGDRSAFYNLRILGFQDTLLASTGRQYYSNCYIAGTIDFICGNARALFQGCTIAYVGNFKSGSIAAQKKESASEKTGFVFQDCTINGRAGSVMLGRAWGNYASMEYYNTQFNAKAAQPVWDILQKSTQNVNLVEVNTKGYGASAWRPSYVKRWNSGTGPGIAFIDGASWVSASA